MMFIDGEIFYVISSFLLLIIALVVTFKRKSAEDSGLFLALYFWVFFYTIFSAFIVNFGYLARLPHIFRTSHMGTLLIMPLSYFYVMMNLYPRKLRVRDLLHLLPLMVFLVDFFPFFILSGNEKMEIFRKMDPRQLRIGYSEGWFMPGEGHVLIRYTMAIYYCITQTLLIRKAMRTPEHPVVFEDLHLMKWMQIMVASETIFFMLPLAALVFLGSDLLPFIASIAAIIVSLIQGYYLMFHPDVLYGSAVYFKKPDSPPAATEVVEQQSPAKPDYYSDENLDQVGAILEQYMERLKPYRKAGYKVQELAEDTGLTIHKISAYVNRRKHMNFSGYLNQYRISYCLEKLAAGEHQVKTLEALAEECGFSNRSTFIRVFKSVTGKTPSEYLSDTANGRQSVTY